MNLRFLSLLAVSAALVSGSLTAAAAPHKHSREIEIRRGCTEYDVDVSSQSGRVIKVDTDNRCDD